MQLGVFTIRGRRRDPTRQTHRERAHQGHGGHGPQGRGAGDGRVRHRPAPQPAVRSPREPACSWRRLRRRPSGSSCPRPPR
ncbi:hypothetical protein QJS66_12145 [Kocuria rhizophila]|nr:hypothetical protein QJS66_12145 [Kocuria rhizophila]